jgi:hypothetical protein
MANMSYCRFHNTLSDLYDCVNALEDFLDNDENVISSNEERRKAKNLIEVCHDVAERWEPGDIDRKAEELSDHDEDEDEDEEG